MNDTIYNLMKEKKILEKMIILAKETNDGAIRYILNERYERVVEELNNILRGKYEKE